MVAYLRIDQISIRPLLYKNMTENHYLKNVLTFVKMLNEYPQQV